MIAPPSVNSFLNLSGSILVYFQTLLTSVRGHDSIVIVYDRIKRCDLKFSYTMKRTDAKCRLNFGLVFLVTVIVTIADIDRNPRIISFINCAHIPIYTLAVRFVLRMYD